MIEALLIIIAGILLFLAFSLYKISLAFAENFDYYNKKKIHLLERILEWITSKQ
jgi:hypothetical protein